MHYLVTIGKCQKAKTCFHLVLFLAILVRRRTSLGKNFVLLKSQLVSLKDYTSQMSFSETASTDLTRLRGFNLAVFERRETERRNSIRLSNFQVNCYSLNKLHPGLNTSSVSVTLNHIQLAFKQRSEGDTQGTFQAPAGSNSVSWKELCWTVGHFSEDGPLDASQKTICFDLEGHVHAHENLWVPQLPTMGSVFIESFPKFSCCRETMRHLNFLWRDVLPSRTGSLIMISLK